MVILIPWLKSPRTSSEVSTDTQGRGPSASMWRALVPPPLLLIPPMGGWRYLLQSKTKRQFRSMVLEKTNRHSQGFALLCLPGQKRKGTLCSTQLNKCPTQPSALTGKGMAIKRYFTGDLNLQSNLMSCYQQESLKPLRCLNQLL